MLIFETEKTIEPGEYLKLDKAKYRDIRNFLNSAQSSLRSLFETPTSSEDLTLQQANKQAWLALKQTTQEVLTDNSRDIEIFSWWLASLAYQGDDLADFSEGLKDFYHCLSTLKEQIHPLLPEEKLKKFNDQERLQKICDTQTKPLSQLIGDSPNSGLLNMAFNQFPLLEGITLNTYLNSQKSGGLDQLKSSYGNEVINQQADLKLRFARLHDIELTLESIEKEINTYRSKNNLSLLGFTYIKSSINELKIMFQYFLPSVISVIQEEEVVVEDDAPVQTTEAVSQDNAQVSQVSNVQRPNADEQYTRDKALLDLSRIAHFFKTTEPHNPIPYLLARAIRWGNLTFPELLQELIQEEPNVFNEINKMTGMDKELGNLEKAPPMISRPVTSNNQSTNGSAKKVSESNNATETPINKPVVKEEPSSSGFF